LRRQYGISQGKTLGLRRRSVFSDSPWHKGVAFLTLIGVLLLSFRPLRRAWYLLQRLPPFLSATFSADGVGSLEGRLLIWGKIRRAFLSLVPPLARHLQKHHKLSGGCTNCGSSCKLLFQCPHWDDESHLCSIYQDRPSICRLYPITPSDLRDRDIVSRKTPCGYNFPARKPAPVSNESLQDLVPVTIRVSRAKKEDLDC
jgi:hypothetical protein